MEKNQTFIGKCVDYTYDGLGVVKYDAFCVFVKDMIKGEVGKIVVTLIKKNFAYGRLLELVKASSERVEPICPISKQCGGCQLQHMSYQEQLFFKKEHVNHEINQIGKINFPINDVIGLEKPFRYRNKVQLPTMVEDGKIECGFYSVNSHKIIKTDSCPLQSDRANLIIRELKKILSNYKIKYKLRHIMLREMVRTNQVMIVLVTYKCKLEQQLIDDIKSIDSSIVSIVQNINDEETNVVLSKNNIVLYGNEYIEDILCGLRFKVAVNSFYQVNSRQTEVLYNKAIELANISKEDTVLDLYCGVGTIGLVASKKAKEVIGIEIVQQAIDNAKENASINNINNCKFICGDVSKLVNDIKDKVDIIFVDPPRKGCDQNTLDHLVTIKPKRIVYVSCNPSTLARDLNFLKDYYQIEQIQPVDMFSQTYHVENITLLVRQ